MDVLLVQRLKELLEDTGIKLAAVASDIMGVSGRAMLEALIAGEHDPQVLAEVWPSAGSATRSPNSPRP